MNLSQICLYRMTHIENIPHILQYGITHRNFLYANPNYIAIGDTSLISTRKAKRVNISNGHRDESYGTIVLGDYIPFYFGVRMPMLYVVQHGGNYVEKATHPQDIIYLVCKLNDVIQSGMTYYFSDGHATDIFTLFYDKTKISEISKIINWEAIESAYWGGEENLEFKRQKQAEFLAANIVSADFLVNFICYNETAKQRLQKLGIDSQKIKVFPKAYY